MKLNNRGFSLVELIVVVLIVAILTGTAGISAVVIYNARAKKAAKALASQLELCRQKTMAKEDKTGTDGVHMKIFLDDNMYYATIYDGSKVISEEQIGSSQLKIKIGPKKSNPSSMTIVGDNGAYALYKFKKSSGGIDPIYTSSHGGNPYLDIYVEGSETYHIMIAEYTGRTYTEEVK